MKKGIQRLDDILFYNKEFVENKKYEQYETSKHPEKKMVVLSCMDTRLTELLPQAMNIKNGDAKIVKNAGATIMHPFGSIVRSILVAVYEFEAEDLFVVGHYGCGMSNLDGGLLLEKMKKRGVTQMTIDTLQYSGIDVESWLHGFESEKAAVEESVEALVNHPLMPSGVRVHGLLMDPATGKLDVVIDASK
ncbi:carbonic anhydrase [Gottschalkiaceae bacterium SANA]|nr:carbonic anhydrase [Gottschalkiaceae bacterium SANA]